MQHHIEEFSVADIRHTLEEVWRIVRYRRWFFIFPFCIASAIALFYSLRLPRRYVAETVIKREQDPVFTSMMGESWTHPYKEIRERMLTDLKNREVIGEVLGSLKLPAGLERYENGELTPASAAALRALGAKISRGLSIESLASSADRDVVAIRLTMPGPEHLPEVLRSIRDKYIASTRGRTVEVLRDVAQFFKEESERCRGDLGRLQQRLVEYEMRYPGIDPNVLDSTRAEQTSLVVERVRLERGLDESQAKWQRLETRIARLSDSAEEGEPGEADVVDMKSNARFMELTREIERLVREVAENKTLRGMTERHPVIKQLRARLEMRREELAATPPEYRVTSRVAGLPGSDPAGPSVKSQLELAKSDVDAKISNAESRLSKIKDRLLQIEGGRAMAAEHRQAYLKLREQSVRVRADLDSYQRNIGPIERIFLVEDRDRTIHFATVKDARPVTRPSSPNARLVMFVCLAIGAAVGALSLLLAELLDRSYRTVKHLSSSLGLPVIEGIDEIVTAAVRRRRLIRSFVLLPTAALICVSMTMVAGAMAYFSLENPSRYDLLKSAPSRTYRIFFGES